MKRPRFLRPRWLLLGLVVLPLLVWGLFLLIIPTDWARGRIVAALREATGRSVQLAEIHVGPLGRVRLAALRVGAPSSADDPWLDVSNASTDLHLLQLLTGCTKPTELEVDGMTLRVLRRKDGTLELSDLLRRPKNAGDPGRESADCCPTVAVHLKNARILVRDERSGTKLEFGDVEGSATWAGPRVTVHDLHGTLNGGTFEMAAQLDRAGRRPTFEGQVRTENVAIAEGMHALEYLVPVLSGTAGAVDGRLDMNVYLKGEGMAADELTRTLAGRGSVKIEPVQLDGSKLVADLGRIIDLPAHNRVGAVKTDFTIKDGRIATEDLTLQVARTPIVLTGWTGFDGTLDYRIKTERLVEKLPGKARDFLAEMQIDLKEVAVVRVQGTLDDMVVSLDGGPVVGKTATPTAPSAPRPDDKQQLRDLGRRLKDRLLR